MELVEVKMLYLWFVKYILKIDDNNITLIAYDSCMVSQIFSRVSHFVTIYVAIYELMTRVRFILAQSLQKKEFACSIYEYIIFEKYRDHLSR